LWQIARISRMAVAYPGDPGDLIAIGSISARSNA
jgi:hypothetical protein